MKRLIISIICFVALCSSATAQLSDKQQIKKLNAVYELIRDSYVDDVSLEPLVQEAIIATFKELDPHSKYLTKEEMESSKKRLHGEFAGIGINYIIHNDTLVVRSTMNNSPAQKADIRPNDRITAVNGQCIVGLSVDAISEHLKGEVGSNLTLRVERRGVDMPFCEELKREIIEQSAIGAAFRIGDVGYISVESFSKRVAGEFLSAYKSLGDIKSLVVDLRDNGGGDLSSALDVCDLFLPKDKLVSILHILCDIAETIEYSSIVVLFDKIDEFQRINADINKITDFCLEILTDTDLLLSNKISIVFSLWSEIKRSLNSRGVRFDKFSDIDVQLSDEGLVKLLNKRLAYFSNDVVTFDSLIPYENSRKDILFVADKSPRTLIKLLNEIYICDFANETNIFEEKSISKGLILFCKKFDYESLLSKGRNDLISWINKLLRVRQHKFTTQMILESLALSLKNAQRYITEMEKIGLIKLLDETTADGQNVYKVEDHRIRYLISKGIISLDD